MVSLERPALTDEADWIAKAKQSDSGAFERLYRMHIDKVYGLCLRVTGNVAEAGEHQQRRGHEELVGERGEEAAELRRLLVLAGEVAVKEIGDRGGGEYAEGGPIGPRALEEEHRDMMERLDAISKREFDNTKRIKRPHEILEERRLERERRNAWHRRAYRAIFGEPAQQQQGEPETKKSQRKA